MGNIILIALYLIFSVSGVVLFKLGTDKGFVVSVSTGVFNLKISLISILGLICYVCSFLMYMFLIAKFDMSYIVPVTTAIVQVATFILAIVIFKESLTITKVIAIALIVLGVGIMNIK
ncbi:hypothetical protein [uncultured Clostridium sp.]|uniref:hypothetical protein n=1 Tax=uncultured Clostridium sp. TaxID=59620 RepID=UPI0025EC0546|nr:hypothetical protein [uncultured Clostridium sp.]